MKLIDLADFALVIDNLEEGILFLDSGRHVITINKAALKMIGEIESINAEEDIIDQLCPALFPGASCAKDCDETGKCSLMNQEIEKEKIEEISFSGLDGKQVTLQMRAMALTSSQHLARIAILLTDCSHERQLEEEVKGIKGRIFGLLQNTGLLPSDTPSL